MGFRLPEKPILFYPSLARQIGTDEALLYTIYEERLQARGEPDSNGNLSLCLGREEWLQLADFWNEARLANVTRSLVNHGYIHAASGEARITVTLLPQLPDTVCEDLPIVETPVVEPEYAESHVPPVPVQKLPVVEQPPSRDDMRQIREQQYVQPQNRGPAPTFGGSIGWSKSRPQPGAGNIFASQLDEIEQNNKKLHSIYLGWRPSQILFDTLPRHSIPAEFAEQLIDEFVLYWLDKDRKETNWDQKFLAWVKREWVQKQTRDAREQRYKQDDATPGFAPQPTRPDNRQKRQQVTAAIMDIKDTDW